MAQITLLDAHTMNPGDLDWSPLQALGTVTIYDYTPPEEIVERALDADILIVNKVLMTRAVLQQLPRLRYICVSATGYNNIDLQAAAEQNIPVSNVIGYSTTAVAQQVFALILELTNQVAAHNDSVARQEWARSKHFSYTLSPIPELAGKTMGIYGFGRIGQQVAEVARAFGMEVLATHRHPKRDARPGVRFVDLEELFRVSDVISLHAPLSPENKGIVNTQLLSGMKPTAYLINTARGPIINEQDLAKALQSKTIAGAALDVLSQEPPPKDHPLTKLENCILTPHVAWASVEARQRLLAGVVRNVEGFLKEGKVRNGVGLR
jgi:glycerate dehydrogenase